MRSGESKRHYVPVVTFPPELQMRDENAVYVEAYYDKGGTNMFSGNHEARGYRVSLGAVKIDDRCVLESLRIGGGGFGRRILVAQAARLDQKKLAALDAAIQPKLAEIVALALVSDYAGINALLQTLAAPIFAAKGAKRAVA